MINAEQIRAARALLDWSTADLAKLADLTINGINKIERGHVQAHRETLETIQKIFESAGVEFTDFSGVRRRPEGIHIYQGRTGLLALMEDIYETCRRGQAGDVVLSGVSEDDFQKHLGDYDKEYLKKMSQLPPIRMRHLIAEGDYNVISDAYSQYRWVPREQFKAVPFYVYGDKLAIILFAASPVLKIFLIQSTEVSDAYRHQFESMWATAKEIPSDAQTKKVRA